MQAILTKNTTEKQKIQLRIQRKLKENSFEMNEDIECILRLLNLDGLDIV